MKKIYLFACLLVITMTAFAQKMPKDSLRKSASALASGDVQKLLPQITPKSPNVTGLERHGDYPVSMYSGLANIEIPLYEIKVGNLIVPLKLSYHSSGNKVNDNASFVGLGWSLGGGDYILSRNIRGKADEEDYANGNSMLQNDLPTLAQLGGCLTTQLKADLNQYVNFGKDIERDIFSYHTPSKSNSFVLLPNQTGVIWQEADKSIFSYTGALQNLTLRDENGTQYAFNTAEQTTSSLTGSGQHNTAWHLNSMQAIKATDKILFSYQANSTFSFTGEVIDTEVYHTDISGSNASSISMGLQSKVTTTDAPSVVAQLLQEITFPTGKINFILSTADRQDNLGKSLDAIEIYGYNISTNQYNLIKKYTFTYIYRQRTDSYSGDVVMFLDKVNLVTNENAVLGSYSFGYKAQGLPAASSRAKDYWGYYNGQTQNTTLIPAFSFTTIGYSPVSQTFQVGGANRDVNESLAKAWVLEKITYPTGGFSTFDYESNRYQDGTGQHLAGGLRMKQIISNDGASATTTKTYKYGASESGNGTIRSLAFQNYQTVQSVKSVQVYTADPQYVYNVRAFSSTMTHAINANEGSSVTYPIVSEYEDDGSGANGKSIYTFKDDVSDDLLTVPANGKMAQRNRFWNRGQLLSKITYGNDGLKKYEQNNTYSTLVTGESVTLGYLVGKSVSRVNSSSPDPTTGCYVDDDSFDPINPITWNYGLVKQTASLEKYYDNQDDTKFTTKQSETTYSATHYQPTEIKAYVSNSIILGKLLWYPQDFTVIPTTASVTGEVNALRSLQQANVLNTVIEEIDYRKDLLAPAPPNAPYLIITGGKFMTFDVITATGSTVENAIVPKTVSLTECIFNTFLNADNSINFNPAKDLFNPSNNTSTIPRNVNHKTRIYFDTYDADGNLTTFHQSDGATTKYTYTTTSNDGLSFVYPTSEIQNYVSPNPLEIKALTSNFSFTIPHLGMSDMTDQSGLKTYFEYDTFGRLFQIKDHNGKIVKKYQYQY